MYQVMALKWRPANFDELVGQTHVSRTLTNAIESDRLAHAYIFAGLRGTGKTTVARILAKCLNCSTGPTGTPCDACDACSEIAESRAMDVMEIDAASRTKVEQTRELLELVSYAPVRDRYKILIIDEAHMLSKASFNALLKTLEEPPPNVIFILATTELGKLLPTILSRCQVFEFRRVGTRDLTAHLRRVCDAESIEISESGLERIARAGEGSVRDSLSVLERVRAFCGPHVDDDDLLRLLGGVKVELLAKMLAGLAARDAAAMLQLLDGLIDEGHELLPFWHELIACVRDLLILRELPQETEMISRSAEEAEQLVKAAAALSVDDLTRAFQLLADLEFGLRSSSQPRYLFESALIRLAALGAVRPIEEVLDALRGAAPAAAPAGARERTASSAAPRPRPQRKSTRPAPPAADTQKKNLPVRGERAAKFVLSVHDAKPLIGAILDQAADLLLDDSALVISFERAHAVVAERLRTTETVELLQQHARAVTGTTVNIRIETGGEPKTSSAADQPPPPGELAAPPSDGQHAPPDDAPPDARGALLEQARNEPGVKKLLREFGAQVVDIRPLKTRQGGEPPEPTESSR